MTFPIAFHPEVRGEVNDAFNWYERQRTGLGEEFLEVVNSALARIRLQPEIPQPIDLGVRRVRLKRFPYRVVYLLETTRIFVISIQHVRRDPASWQTRV
jgi:plasmid stabilization system protein ParE